MYFMAFDGQDDPLRGWAHSEHEVVPEFLGLFPKRRFPHLRPISGLGDGVGPRWDALRDQVLGWMQVSLGLLPEPVKFG